MQTEFGFREHAHTADWELEVWAPDLATLFVQAALGMYALSGVILQPGRRLRKPAGAFPDRTALGRAGTKAGF
jgi:hypothetical protein